MSAVWFPGSAREPVAPEAPPREAEPRLQCVSRRSLGNEELDERPCMEIYLNDPSEVPEAELRTDICIPLK